MSGSPRVIVLMGVAGSGKSTVGLALAEKLGARFVDADDFHPPANVEKMSSGVPLDDADRRPWLDAMRREVIEAATEKTVLACSALKRTYRKRLGVDGPDVGLVYLAGSRELLWKRISGRDGHFMKPEMLDSQLDALEEPDADEGTAVSIDAPVAEIVATIVNALEEPG
ncbi:MAG: gluconokinase [Verrucomicrobiae bacterium]|nr:gluconokinase [Verrucomicrobiae bacterium]